MAELVSIIIPNRNGGATIRQCLRAALASHYANFEVIVVDDGSTDCSVDIIKQFPCVLIELGSHCGTSAARNSGVKNSNGTILFFTDADCLLQEESLSIAINTLTRIDKNSVLGGSYTVKPVDESFFGRFQSAFIHYFETKNSDNPDYIAGHTMVLYADTFNQNDGFSEGYLPIIEDVEFSHRLRRNGCTLVINPEIQVRHIFNYSLFTSLNNGFRKAMYWTIYSLHNKDLLTDSGTASIALKLNVVSLFVTCFIIALMLITEDASLSAYILLVIIFNLVNNIGVLRAFNAAGKLRFVIAASAYYLLLYPLAVGLGGIAGLVRYNRHVKLMKECT